MEKSVLSANETRRILEEREKVTPIAKRNGADLVSYEDAVLLGQAEALFPEESVSPRKVNADGTYASTGRRFAAVDPEVLFLNRYKKTGAKKMQVVTDYRAIKEQTSGSIYTNQIVAYGFERKENGTLVLAETTTVSEREFVNDFTQHLDKESMRTILPMIENAGDKIKESKMPI